MVVVALPGRPGEPQLLVHNGVDVGGEIDAAVVAILATATGVAAHTAGAGDIHNIFVNN